MAMTMEQKMELAKVILPALSGAASGALSGRAQSQQNQLTQQQNQLSQMSNEAQIAQMLQQMKMQQAQAGLNAMPLGLEQQYVQKQRMMQALLPAMAQWQSARPTDPGILSAYKPGSNIVSQFASNPQLQQAFGDQGIETALGNYRRLVAQADPRISMQSLSGYGLSDGQDQGVEDVRMTALADQKAYEQGQTDLAAQQTQMTKGQAATQPEKKKGGFWSKVGSIAKVAVPIVLAATGVGIPAAMAITAGTNIAASKMQGKDWGDALKSGAVGAATGAVGAGALGSASRAGMSAATQRAVAQGVLSGADTKLQGGSWGEALASGASGAASSKMQDVVRGKIGGGSGLNNSMTSQSLPLGSTYSNANAPGMPFDVKGTMGKMANMQLQARPMTQTPLPQGVQQQAPQQAPQYPMVNKVKQAVMGQSSNLPTQQFGSFGSQPPSGPAPMANAADEYAKFKALRAQQAQQDYHKAYSNTAQQVPIQRPSVNDRVASMAGGTPYQQPQLQRAMPGTTELLAQLERFMQNPGVQAAQSPAGAIAGTALMGQIGNQMVGARTAQQNVQNVMNQLGRNNGVDNSAFNMAAQDVYKSVPGQVVSELSPAEMNAYRIMQMLKANNGMTQDNRAAALVSPEAQSVFAQVPGQVTQALTPQQLAKIIADNAKTRSIMMGR